MIVLEYIVSFLKTPALVLAIVALIGLISLKKTATEVIKGTIKVILGFLILNAGAGVIYGALVPLSDMFLSAFKMPGLVPDENVLAASVQTALGFETAIIMVGAFLVNVLIARVTKWKYIFLTGHMMFSFAACLAISMAEVGLTGWAAGLVGALIQGAASVFFPAIMQPTGRKVTGTNDFAMGFWASSAILISAQLSRLFAGKAKKDADDLKVPESLSFLKDMSISMSIIMLIIYIVVAIFAGEKTVELAGGANQVAPYVLLNALTFVGGILILLQGVRMFIGELIPAFKGFAEKIVPDAIPALDIPVYYAYGSVSLTIGFITCLIGMVLALFFTARFAQFAILPSVMTAFFCGGAAGIFGNKLGGRNSAIAAGFIYGFFITVAFAFLWPLMGDVTKYGASVGMANDGLDFLLVNTVIKLIASIF